LWSFGEKNYEILKELVLLRNRLQPYIKKHMDKASALGIPVMRPMFFDYPEDEGCYSLGEQYMFGDDILFAPITRQGQTIKSVYLPEGEWILTKDRSAYDGGQWYEIPVQISEFVAFIKSGTDTIELMKL
jgi:alpha-D-xyloside xylohydrolase